MKTLVEASVRLPTMPLDVTVVFRVDASTKIGSGHVMRCLTLAEELAWGGRDCLFVCRATSGDLASAIRARGFVVVSMERAVTAPIQRTGSNESYEDWLVGGWRQDLDQTLASLVQVRFQWLIVDHYGIDHRWETAFRASRPSVRIACIDDLADRVHDCDLLLDQNLGRRPHDYAQLVPPGCKILVGTSYALVRSEFREARAASLVRRQTLQRPRRVLINFGGVDSGNVTEDVLDALAHVPGSHSLRVDIVMGLAAPHLKAVLRAADRSQFDTKVHVDTTRMAYLMTMADVAVGAGGGTSWERCCLGLPSLVLEIALNQRDVVRQLASHDVAYVVDQTSLVRSLLTAWKKIQSGERLLEMSKNASTLVVGNGASLVAESIIRGTAHETR
ncbi:UDP-2,4-diacetamido-2,4,6-trideoxy-beta-L-altropyranose hydrolase [Arthrobacter pigmenti]